MVIIVYSGNSDKTIPGQIGLPDYSYFFVLRKFYSVLSKLADVIEIESPSAEVDAIYNNCLARGEFCLFLSFTPPFKTHTDLKCPTISVFAWEYTTIPTDTWSNEPRNDWRNVFHKHKCAITHSNFTATVVKKAMGDAFPVWSIPAPVWDDYNKLFKKSKHISNTSDICLAYNGSLIDIKGCDAPFVGEEDRKPFIEKHSKIGDCELFLKGITYTSAFNPADSRKNWSDLVKGFIWAFRDRQDVTLVLKLIHHDFEEAHRTLMDEIFKLTPFKCRIAIVHGYLKEPAYSKLIQVTTYIVNTAHGEGQCLPLMEFMSAGKPAIAPNHTAMEEYVNANNSFILESSLEKAHWPHDPRYALRTMRYRINWESLFLAYRQSYYIAKNDIPCYTRMSSCAAASLRNHCSKAIVRAKIRSAFKELRIPDESFFFKTRRKSLRLARNTIRCSKTLHNRLQYFRRGIKRYPRAIFHKLINMIRIFRMKVWNSWHQN